MGLDAQQQFCCRQFVGWVGRGLWETWVWRVLISPDQCSFIIGCVGKGFNIGKMVSTCRLPGRGSDKGAMVIVPLALTLVSHNPVFPRMSLAPPELLTLCQHPR